MRALKITKVHLREISLLSLWMVLFLVVIAPYDVGNLSFAERLFKMPFYGFLFLGLYLFLTSMEDKLRSCRNQYGTIINIVFYSVLTVLFLMLSFSYYRLPMVNGGSNLSAYTTAIFLPIFLMILPFVFLLRRKNSGTVQVFGIRVLKGENKQDVLTVEKEQLVAVKSSGNYVEVHYLEDDVVKRKLLRNTLKNIVKSESYLIQVHRSCLINPDHIVALQKNMLILTKMRVKTSEKYRTSLRSSLKNTIRP